MNENSFRVVQQGDRVLILVDGKLVANMPWQTALKASNAIQSVGKLAEEWAKAECIAADQALLFRAGAPFGLTNNPTIQAEAVKQGLYDRTLRRALPGGVKSESVVGTPAITQTPPPRTPK